ncbi:MAG TPA: hypothetical protein VF765_26080 [Polyangiaceae bacterium]
MVSSTSSSEAPVAAVERAFARGVPSLAWRRIAAIAFSVTLLAMLAWELRMRQIGLRAGDLDDGVGQWAAERRKVDAGPRDPVVLVGDSRILFDTDLDIFADVTGRRPIQLALPGTPGAQFLTDLGDDEHFAGLVVVGMMEHLYFSSWKGLFGKALDYVHDESPSQRSGVVIHLELSRTFAFLDKEYSLFNLIERNDIPNRGDVEGPYLDVWKLSETFDDRQTRMWSRIQTDPRLQQHAIAAWHDMKGKPLPQEQIDKTIAAAKRACERIRARGGEVVFLRPPSAQPNRANEEARAPRARVWDVLLRETGSVGIHFEDYPAMQGLEIPERSHLSAESAKVFTRAYAGELVRQVPWLATHARPH